MPHGIAPIALSWRDMANFLMVIYLFQRSMYDILILIFILYILKELNK